MTQQEEYESLLSTMDWHYAYTDDHTYYKKCQRQWERICELMKIIDKDQSIYKSYVKEK